jgi:hypothetical protein
VTIQDWGSIGELVAAIATVATLAYLAIQIRANTRAARAQSGQARTASTKQQLLALAQNQHLAGVFRRGLADLQSLEPDEQIQFTFLVTSFLSDAHASFTDMELGVSDRSTFEVVWTGLRLLLKTPGGMEVWQRTASSYTPEFRTIIDSDLSGHGSGVS